MTSDRQFWLILAKLDYDREPGVYAVDFPASQTVTASEAAEEFRHRYAGTFSVIRVAPTKAPERWDVFDVVPERVVRREGAA